MSFASVERLGEPAGLMRWRGRTRGGGGGGGGGREEGCWSVR